MTADPFPGCSITAAARTEWPTPADAAVNAAAVAARIRARPDNYAQGQWAAPADVSPPNGCSPPPALAAVRDWDASCGMTGCVAGHAALLLPPGSVDPTCPVDVAGAAALGLPAPGGVTADIRLFDAALDSGEVLAELDRLAAGGARDDAIDRALAAIPAGMDDDAIEQAYAAAEALGGLPTERLPGPSSYPGVGWAPAGMESGQVYGSLSDPGLWDAWCERVAERESHLAAVGFAASFLDECRPRPVWCPRAARAEQ